MWGSGFFPPLLGSQRARRPALGSACPSGNVSSSRPVGWPWGHVVAREREQTRLAGRGNNERLVVLGAVGKVPPGCLPGRCLGAFSHSSTAESPEGESMTGQAPLSKQDLVSRARRLHRAEFLHASQRLAGWARIWAGTAVKAPGAACGALLCPWPRAVVPMVPSPLSPW